MAREQTNYKVIIGKRGGEYYALDYVFTHDETFKGTVGSCFIPVTRAQYASDMEHENLCERLRDLWADCARNNATDQSLDDWVRDYVAADGDSAIYDLSYYDMGEEAARIYNAELPPDHDAEDEAEFSECVGGGRCFQSDMEWDVLYRPDLWAIILQYEQIAAQ